MRVLALLLSSTMVAYAAKVKCKDRFQDNETTGATSALKIRCPGEGQKVTGNEISAEEAIQLGVDVLAGKTDTDAFKICCKHFLDVFGVGGVFLGLSHCVGVDLFLLSLLGLAFL